MKLLNLLFVVFLSACTVQGDLVSSQGLVKGWDHSGFRSVKNGVEVLFLVQNDNYLALNETLLGVTTKDRKAAITPVIGKKPFLIRVNVKTTNAEVYVKQSAKLILDGKEHLPNLVKLGEDTIKSGRVSHEILAVNYKDFMHINNKLQGGDISWLWFEFDMITPNPNKPFTLLLEMKNGADNERLEANFNAKNVNIYHH